MTPPAIDVQSLRKEYDGEGGTVVALDDVSISIDQGTVTGLLGPNGAGKTTLIKCMLGLVTPTSGSVRIDGIDAGADRRAVYERVSATFEGARNVYWRLTPRENMDFFLALQGKRVGAHRERREEILESVDLLHKADEPVRELSRGMQQKVSLACTLVRDTPIVFLDEPTLGLDVETELALSDKLRGLFEDESRTVLLSSHNMDVVERICDDIVVVGDGQVIAHDDIDAILGEDDGTTYRIRFEEGVGTAVRRRLRNRFAVRRIDDSGDDVAVEVVLDRRERIFDLMHALEDEGVVPETLGHVERSLEDVIIELTADEGAQREEAPTVGGVR